ncbi:hypothetical protein UP12_19405 (plasmid) [Bacillus pumilus]|uniref:hypothetical protein n=1 Tax=Bacillus pumilus TaxID=1408 RepID=UPI0007760189|nr:hypothetical protein [Bacillus pumilus]AMM99577.1 hypothetical protein UP12_19405 [Bacillus pumilus]
MIFSQHPENILETIKKLEYIISTSTNTHPRIEQKPDPEFIVDEYALALTLIRPERQKALKELKEAYQRIRKENQK